MYTFIGIKEFIVGLIIKISSDQEMMEVGDSETRVKITILWNLQKNIKFKFIWFILFLHVKQKEKTYISKMNMILVEVRFMRIFLHISNIGRDCHCSVPTWCHCLGTYSYKFPI